MRRNLKFSLGCAIAPSKKQHSLSHTTAALLSANVLHHAGFLRSAIQVSAANVEVLQVVGRLRPMTQDMVSGHQGVVVLPGTKRPRTRPRASEPTREGHACAFYDYAPYIGDHLTHEEEEA